MRAGLVVWFGVPVFFAGCVSSSSFDAIEVERDLLTVRVAELEEGLSACEASAVDLEAAAEHALAAQAAEALEATAAAETRVTLGLLDGQTLKAVLRTSKGDIHCDLWPEVAPKTVLNFVGLAEGTREWTDPRTREARHTPLYDGTVFHRVIPGFMIQGGDPLGNGTGGPGYRFEDEVTPEVTFSEPGLLAMANAGPGTNGSQFFVTDSTPRHLDGKHTIFGKCDLEVVRAIMAVPPTRSARGQSSTPSETITLQTVIVERS